MLTNEHSCARISILKCRTPFNDGADQTKVAKVFGVAQFRGELAEASRGTQLSKKLSRRLMLVDVPNRG